MKSFISALALIATLAAASENDPAYYNIGGSGRGAHGTFGLGGMPSDYRGGYKPDPKDAPIKIIGATKYTSQSVLGGSNFNSKSSEIMPDYYDETSHYDDYEHGKDGWKAMTKGDGDAAAKGATKAFEAAGGATDWSAWADIFAHKDAAAQGSHGRTGGSDDYARGGSKWAAGAGGWKDAAGHGNRGSGKRGGGYAAADQGAHRNGSKAAFANADGHLDAAGFGHHGSSSDSSAKGGFGWGAAEKAHADAGAHAHGGS